MGDFIYFCATFDIKSDYFIHVRCWPKESRKTKGKTWGLEPWLIPPNYRIRVAHASYIYANFSSIIIGLFSVSFENDVVSPCVAF